MPTCYVLLLMRCLNNPHQLALWTKFGPPPKVVWLRGCDCPTQAAERLIRDRAIRIAKFLDDEDQSVLIVTA